MECLCFPQELLKLRKKITSTVQVLTHLKEKLQFVQGENLEQSENLKKVESSLAQVRSSSYSGGALLKILY